MPDKQSSFSSDFDLPDHPQWLSLVEKTLKGQPFEKTMQSTTLDGIVVDALSTVDSNQIDAQPIRAHGDWAIASPNWGNDAQAVNRDILIDLERGASSIALTLSADGDMGIAPHQLRTALEGVYLDMVPLNLIQGEDFSAGVTAYSELVGERNYTSDALTGSLGVDPIGTLARTGKLQTTAEQAIADGAAIATEWSKRYPCVAIFSADGTVICNAGGTEAMEVAGAVSSAITYLRAMEKSGLSLDVAATQIQFAFSASADLWLTIAKFRAARRLWQNVLAVCGVEDVPMRLNAVSAVNALSKSDPWVNILRGTASCFAAAIGGADTITTLPHDLFLGTTNDFSRRIARNIQIILMEESNLGRVSDPSAGSYAIEKMTSDLAEKSVELFADMELAGGILSVLRSGKLSSTIANVADQRGSDIRKRKISITGVSEFPNIHEPPLDVPPIIATVATERETGAAEIIAPLPLRRLSQEFEDLRLRSDEVYLKTGKRPKIALVNFGTATDYTGRASFAKNFFEAGGIETIADAGASTVEQAADNYKASGADIAVLCGTDQLYMDLGADLTKAIKALGCIRLYLAGKPAGLDVSSIDECIFMGCDVIASVENAYIAMGYMEAGGVK